MAAKAIREVSCIHQSVISNVEIVRTLLRHDLRLIIDGRWSIVRAIQVRIVMCIRRCVALVWKSLVFAHLELVGRDALRLQLQRRFDEGCEEAGDQMPVYVAVECPDACRVLVSRGGLVANGAQGIHIWVICYVAEGQVTTRIDLDDVAAYGSRWGVDGFSTVDTGAGRRTLDNLEVVTV